jgi:hypothetical protein
MRFERDRGRRDRIEGEMKKIVFLILAALLVVLRA